MAAEVGGRQERLLEGLLSCWIAALACWMCRSACEAGVECRGGSCMVPDRMHVLVSHACAWVPGLRDAGRRGASRGRWPGATALPFGVGPSWGS